MVGSRKGLNRATTWILDRIPDVTQRVYGKLVLLVQPPAGVGFWGSALSNEFILFLFVIEDVLIRVFGAMCTNENNSFFFILFLEVVS
jgi:hypothetical protein